MKKIISSIVLSSLFLVFSPARANADVSCQPIYGGGQTCVQTGNIVIDKKVQNPQTKAMVDNLGVNDPKYGPDGIVTFQISVTNTSTNTVNKVQVKDIFPQFFTFSAGAGNYDANAKTLSFDINDLKANETRNFNIVGKIVPANELPVDRGIVCVVNQAKATLDDKTSQDNAQICIEKDAVTTQPGVTVIPSETKGGLKVFPAPVTKKAPATGPELLALFGLLPTGFLGHWIRKKTNLK